MNELILALSLISQLGLPAPQGANEQPQKFVSIHVGATLKEALLAYGPPFQAKESTAYSDGHAFLQLIYVNDVCSGSSCSVIIENGKVVKFMDVKPELYL